MSQSREYFVLTAEYWERQLVFTGMKGNLQRDTKNNFAGNEAEAGVSHLPCVDNLRLMANSFLYTKAERIYLFPMTETTGSRLNSFLTR